jgi:hypothetical protein
MLGHDAVLSAGGTEAAFRASSSARNSRDLARRLFFCARIRKKRAVSPDILDIDNLHSSVSNSFQRRPAGNTYCGLPAAMSFSRVTMSSR